MEGAKASTGRQAPNPCRGTVRGEDLASCLLFLLPTPSGVLPGSRAGPGPAQARPGPDFLPGSRAENVVITLHKVLVAGTNGTTP